MPFDIKGNFFTRKWITDEREEILRLMLPTEARHKIMESLTQTDGGKLPQWQSILGYARMIGIRRPHGYADLDCTPIPQGGWPVDDIKALISWDGEPIPWPDAIAWGSKHRVPLHGSAKDVLTRINHERLKLLLDTFTISRVGEMPKDDVERSYGDIWNLISDDDSPTAWTRLPKR